MSISAPFDYDLDTFLKGPNYTGRLITDLPFTNTFDEFMSEHEGYIEPDVPYDTLPFLKDSELVSGVYYRSFDCGIIAFSASHNPIGTYFGSSLVLDKRWQGRGLGRELVIHRCVMDGINPTWNTDVPAYSPAGLAAHISAWNHVNGL